MPASSYMTKMRDFLKNNNWAWHYNPFVGTRELNGLKVIMMLTSNWDNKDARDQDRGPNTGSLEYRLKDRIELRYLISDWGGSMGSWGNLCCANRRLSFR
jgi:hypothetical protein